MTDRATPDDVRRLAALARIEVPEESLADFARSFDSVLAYVGALEELEIPAHGRVLAENRNVLRVDENPTTPGTYTDALVAQFPQREGNSLSVKKIISHD